MATKIIFFTHKYSKLVVRI